MGVVRNLDADLTLGIGHCADSLTSLDPERRIRRSTVKVCLRFCRLCAKLRSV